MVEQEPIAELAAFSSDDAVPTSWAQARGDLQDARVFWLSTVRPDGRPHVTPLLGVWLDDAFYFCTGSTERKAKNLAQNPHCAVTTGSNEFDGLDLVVEGKVTKVSDAAELRRVADQFESKYGTRLTAPEGTGMDSATPSGKVTPLLIESTATAFGFGKGKQFSQTRWRFSGAVH